jgi:hypothetical protein
MVYELVEAGERAAASISLALGNNARRKLWGPA